jgi:isopenicillin N synthase-like dioxygenase
MQAVQPVGFVPGAHLAPVQPTRVDLTIIPHADFVRGDADTIAAIKQALLTKGIVGIRGIPGFRPLVEAFIDAARKFSALSLAEKQAYVPNRKAGEWLGYEIGKEKFQRPDGSWIKDDAKNSYYAQVPEHTDNKWPHAHMDLKTPYLAIGQVMANAGREVMEKIGLLGPNAPVQTLSSHQVGRMLHYATSRQLDNPYWCGAHFDHGLFTALLPAYYFTEKGDLVPEPEEAGLYVRAADDTEFKKVVSDDHDVLLFQAAEWGQIASNDAIRATEHRVHKAHGNIERFTMALFFAPDYESTVNSTSVLTQDERYSGGKRYLDWHLASLKRYEVQEEELDV